MNPTLHFLVQPLLSLTTPLPGQYRWKALSRVLSLGLIVLSLILSCMVIRPVLAAPLLAQAPDEVNTLRQQQQQLEWQRQRVAQERERLRNLQKAAEANLNALQQTIEATTIQIQDYQYQLQLAQRYLKEFQEDLAQATQEYQRRQSATVARLQFLQRQQRRQGFALLLQSRNLNQFLDRRYQLRRIYQADQTSLQELKVQADQLQQQRLEVERQRNQIALLTQQLLAQKSQFKAQADSQQEMINRLRQDRAALEAAEAQLLRDSANLTILIQQRVAAQRQREAAGGPRIAVRGTGAMSYPTEGPITSPFGWRVHPILGRSRFHAGIDFGADYGTTIRAADSGTVIYADWYGGYGNAVIIDHGNGITTLYGHASQLFVSEGQTVQRGEPIAAVGSTGFSTGPHLHFEVRKDGEPVDPMGYLAG